jgi:hypothetical protein
VTAATARLPGNVGPALGFRRPGRGRLEIVPVIVLFTRVYWRA